MSMNKRPHPLPNPPMSTLHTPDIFNTPRPSCSSASHSQAILGTRLHQGNIINTNHITKTREVWKRLYLRRIKVKFLVCVVLCKPFAKQTETELQTHHSQKSSESTVPMKPFTSSSVHTLLEGTSNGSMPVKCQITTRGRSSTASKRPTNPAEEESIILYLKCHIDSFKSA